MSNKTVITDVNLKGLQMNRSWLVAGYCTNIAWRTKDNYKKLLADVTAEIQTNASRIRRRIGLANFLGPLQ
jgi:hypothetical protein